MIKIIIIVNFIIATNLAIAETKAKITANETTMNIEQNIDSGSKKKFSEIYPPAGQQLRWMIYLPKQNDELNYQIEISAGKNVEVDCNYHSLSGSFSEHVLEGWGYNFFQFNTSGHVLSTLMGCPESSKQLKFVAANSLKTSYNSKLPIVVYTPTGYLLRYRFWRADTDFNFAQQN